MLVGIDEAHYRTAGSRAIVRRQDLAIPSLRPALQMGELHNSLQRVHAARGFCTETRFAHFDQPPAVHFPVRWARDRFPRMLTTENVVLRGCNSDCIYGRTQKVD